MTEQEMEFCNIALSEMAQKELLKTGNGEIMRSLMNSLLPCPICGAEATMTMGVTLDVAKDYAEKIKADKPFHVGFKFLYDARCSECGHNIGAAEHPVLAALAWNMKAGEHSAKGDDHD